MNQLPPAGPQLPNVSPLLQWLEDTGVISKGTTEQVNKLADTVKGLGNALKSSGVIR